MTYVQPTLDTLASGISPTAGLIQNTGTIRATVAATSAGEVYLVEPNGKILHDWMIAATIGRNVLTSGSTESSADEAETRASATRLIEVGGYVKLEADESSPRSVSWRAEDVSPMDRHVAVSSQD